MDQQIRQLEQRANAGDAGAIEALVESLRRIDAPMTLELDGETFTVTEATYHDEGHFEIEGESEDGEDRSYSLFESSEDAGTFARQYWVNMAQDYPDEIAAILGNDCLIAWGLGQDYAPGSRSVGSLSEWLDLWEETPEEQWASYDNTEVEVERVSYHLRDLIGFDPTVAYRVN